MRDFVGPFVVRGAATARDRDAEPVGRTSDYAIDHVDHIHPGAMAPDLPGDATTAATIAIGETIIGDGESVGDSDWFQVTFIAGETYQINLTGIDGFDPRLRIRDVDGAILADHDDIDFPQDVNSVITFAATNSGTFFIEALGPYNIGQYELSIVELYLPDDDFAGNTTTTGTVDVDGSATGSAEQLDDQDWFAVQLEAGQVYEFRATGIDGFDPKLSLVDADSVVLRVNDDIDYPANVDSLLTYAIAESGTYFVAVEAPYVIGDYDVSVVSLGAVQDDFAGDQTTAGVLQDGVPQTGEFELEGDTDWFKMELESGRTYSIFTLYDDPGFRTPDSAIYDTNGAELASGLGSEDDNYFFYTATYSGDHYFGLTDTFPTYDSYQIEFWEDNAADEVDLATVVPAINGAGVDGAIEIGIDWDFFQFVLEEGKYYALTFDADEFASLEFELTDYGPPIFGSTINQQASDPFVFKAVSNSAVMQLLSDGVETGTYRFSLTELATVDDYGSSFETAETVALGQTYEGSIEASFDNDVFAYEFDAGVAYTIALAADNGALNEDFYIRILDADGNQIVEQSLTTNNGPTTAYFAAPESGTYFVDVYTQDFDGMGDYTIRVSDDPILRSPVASVGDIAALDDSVITYYFADEGYEYGTNPQFFSTDYTSEVWTEVSKDAMRSSMDVFESAIDIEFIEAASAADADFILVNDWDTNVGGFFGGPTTDFAGLGVFDLRAPETDPDYADSLNPGGGFFEVLTHELGHGLGLKHPHDDGPTTQGELMINVRRSLDLGLFDLNQGVFTVMSYNEGWLPPSNLVPRSDFIDYGFQAGLGALDIAALGEKYGFNTEFALGDDVYHLSDANESGVGYKAIWDNGGDDEIRYSGSKDAVIDLNDATLEYEVGGGGFVSFVDGVKAGFTIAKGVVIENAASGDGNDHLIGNEDDNVLVGNAGDDILAGGGGNDTLDGGDGNDTADYLMSGSGVRVNIGKSGNQNTKGAGRDQLIDIENVIGSNEDDRLTGDFGDNVLSGAGGDDRLFGKLGNDTLKGGSGEDLLRGGWGQDILEGGEGDDLLQAGFGDDVLNGGRGNDSLRGGWGADTFVFGTGDGQDQIEDFFVGFDWLWFLPGDKIQLSFEGIVSFDDLHDIASQVDHSTVLNFGNGDELLLQGRDFDHLNEDHFAFV